MTQERIQTRYPLGGPFATQAELEQAITQAITTHRQDFFPLLERLVDVGDTGSTSVRRTRCGCSASNSLTAVKEWPISTTSPTSPRAA
jgi:hypothetical protein